MKGRGFRGRRSRVRFWQTLVATSGEPQVWTCSCKHSGLALFTTLVFRILSVIIHSLSHVGCDVGRAWGMNVRVHVGRPHSILRYFYTLSILRYFWSWHSRSVYTLYDYIPSIILSEIIFTRSIKTRIKLQHNMLSRLDTVDRWHCIELT